MGVRTGKPRGRPKGARNKSSVNFEKALVEKAKQVDDIVDGAFTGDAHVYLMSIYKDPEMPMDKRIDAAKAALPYEKPKLANVQMAANMAGELSVTFKTVYEPAPKGKG